MTESPSTPPSAQPVLALDTHKNRVVIYETRVHKTLGSLRSAARHMKGEVEALRRLAGIDRVPVLIATEPDSRTIIMTRVPGKPLSECEVVEEHTMASLKELIEQILERGVARHSLPARDVIVAADGTAGLVDFERSTRRLFRCDPAWLIARLVTRYHIMRLVQKHAPQLLTPREQRWLGWLGGVRAVLQPTAKLKKRLLRAIGHS